MKHIFITLSFFLVAHVSNSQTFQGTVKAGSLPTSIIVAIKPSAAVTNAKITTFYFAVAVPATALPRPTLTLLTNFNTALGYTPETVTAPELVDGALHYIYNFLADGSTIAGTERNYAAGVDNNMVELVFGGGPPAPSTSTIKLVSLADGGATLNSYFNIYSSGVDVTNTTAMFYGGSVVNSASGYSGTSFTNLANVTLPIKFIGFNAIKRGNNALLNWQIVNESDQTDRYEVERSLNSVDFTKVSSLAAKYNGNSSNSYELTDLNIAELRTAGIFYYRIKQFDKDGRYIYSEIRSVRFTNNGIVIGVFPNPIKEFANLTIDLEEDVNATVTISDASGKQVKNIQMQLFKGPNVKKINMASLAAGSYMLKLQTLKELKTMAVVKEN